MMSKEQSVATRDLAAGPADAVPASATGEAHRATAPRWAHAMGGPTGRSVKILFVAANHQLGDKLALDEEYRVIQQSIRAARYRDAFQLIPQLAARRSDLEQALLEHSPDVVHFACHGNAQAEVLLFNDGPGAEAISPQALASLFRVLQDNLGLVVFNACFAAGQALAIRQHAGIAIGMREGIDDRVAIEFARALYGALAYGRSVREAFDLGVAAVEAVDARWKHVPQMFVDSGIEAQGMRLVGHPRARRVAWPVAAMLLCGTLILGWLLSQASTPPGGSDPEGPGASTVADSAVLPRGLQSPAPGMTRFAATSMRPGVFAQAQAPEMCAPRDSGEGCTELRLPEQVAPVAVQAFDLDVLEVTHGDYARWLMKTSDAWTVSAKGVVRAPGTRGLALVLPSEECGGGLVVSAQGRVAARLDRASWPVVCVTWHGASAYCRAQGKRLPLEVEWELAARGGGGRAFPWGGDLPRHDGVVFDRRDGTSAHPRDVGTSAQDVSPEGVRDLGGNVAEWVEDGRGDTVHKTIRGGSWASRGPCPLLGSSCKRIGISSFSSDVGFRCARSVMQER